MTGAINSILNDPDQMKKVMEMAGQIMGNSGETGATESSDGQATPSVDNILSSLGGGTGGVDPQLMQLLSGAGAKLGSLFGGKGGLSGLLGGSSMGGLLGGASPLGKLFGGGAGMQGMIQNAAQSFNGSNDKKQLIEALKPYLSEDRRLKLDRAIVFAKVMHVAGAAAFLGGGPK